MSGLKEMSMYLFTSENSQEKKMAYLRKKNLDEKKHNNSKSQIQKYKLIQKFLNTGLKTNFQIYI